MSIKERIPYLAIYLVYALYPCIAAYILIFTANSEYITLSDNINAFIKDPESIYILTGLFITFILNLLAFIALIKLPLSHVYFKYLLAYLWGIVVVLSIFWRDLNILSIIAAGVVSFGYYQFNHGKNI